MIALFYPAALLGILHAGGYWLWALVPFNIVIIPAVDQVIRRASPTWRVPQSWQRVIFAPPAFWIYGAAQAATLAIVMFYVKRHALSPVLFMGLASSTGIMTGTAGITAAHELIHRKKKWERALGLWFLAMVSYMHFRVEHVYGHHRYAATDLDPASARLGEKFPEFFWRTLRGGWSSAWRIEITRASRRGWARFGIRNRMLAYSLIQIAIYVAILMALGWICALFFALQSLMAVHLLEAVNYVQHYGLRRASDNAEKVERFSYVHAWDGPDPLSGLLSFNIGTHAMHHIDVGTDCFDLKSFDKTPRLPYSFFLMVFIALIPPLWSRVMDRHVYAQISMDPSVRAPVLMEAQQPRSLIKDI